MKDTTVDPIAAVAFVGIAFAVSQLMGWTALVVSAVLVAWREHGSH